MFVILFGGLNTGYTCVGTFPNCSNAQDYVKDHLKGFDAQVLLVKQPREPELQIFRVTVEHVDNYVVEIEAKDANEAEKLAEEFLEKAEADHKHLDYFSDSDGFKADGSEPFTG